MVVFVTSIPLPSFTAITVPALALVDIVILPVVDDIATLLPAVNCVAPAFVTVTSPVDGFVVVVPDAVIPVPSNTESTDDNNPGISTVTLLFVADAVTPVPVKFQLAVSVVSGIPLPWVYISVGVGPSSDQVPSPLR